MNTYSISGLGADERIFQYLEPPIIPLKWLKPYKDEAIAEYAGRMISQIDTSRPFALIGVSFGGLIAIEINKIIEVEKTILISSAAFRKELPLLYRISGNIGLLKIIPVSWFRPPAKLISILFRTRKTKLIAAILRDTDVDFNKWAAIQLVNWQNQQLIKVVKIHGTRDYVLKMPPDPDYIIQGGGHFMIVDKASEISKILQLELDLIRK